MAKKGRGKSKQEGASRSSKTIADEGGVVSSKMKKWYSKERAGLKELANNKCRKRILKMKKI